MAKFTAQVALNIKWYGNELVGPPGTVHRIPDALYDEFHAQVEPTIPGIVTWNPTDEFGAISTPYHSDLLGVTSDQHHAQVHGIASSDHTASGLTAGNVLQASASNAFSFAQLSHASLSSVSANQHHSQVHSISGSDHTGTLTHAALGSVTANQHHNQAHAFTGSDHTGFSSGTSFPGSPSTDDMCRRTDLDLWFFYDGTRWLSMELFSHQVPWVSTANTQPISATAANELQSGTPYLNGGSDIWLVNSVLKFAVNGGTALGASHNWVLDIQKYSAAEAQTTIVTHTISSGASDATREDVQAINALMNNGTIHHFFLVDATKTGTPGTLSHAVQITYRIVAT